MKQLQEQAPKREQNVLKGPPGLLFGLTLLIFIAARLYLGWVTSHETESAAMASPRPAPEVSILHGVEAKESPAHRFRFVAP